VGSLGAGINELDVRRRGATRSRTLRIFSAGAGVSAGFPAGYDYSARSQWSARLICNRRGVRLTEADFEGACMILSCSGAARFDCVEEVLAIAEEHAERIAKPVQRRWPEQRWLVFPPLIEWP
jgi:hypothetical protein